ncbi:MAG: exosortase U, partial [Planctomycetota bacterium]
QIRGTIPNMLGIVPLICLLLQLPLQLDRQIITELQIMTTSAAASFLDQLGIVNWHAGTTLKVAGRNLFVEEACSGIQSLFALLFVSILLYTLRRRRIWLLPTYVIAAIGIAFFANMTRIVAIAVGLDVFPIDMTTGVSHAVLGYACLTGGALLLLSFDAMAGFLFHPVVNRGYSDDETNPLVTLWNWFLVQPPADDASEKTTDSSGSIPLPMFVCGGACMVILVIWQGNLAFQSGAAQNVVEISVSDAPILDPLSQPLMLEVNGREVLLQSHRAFRDGERPELSDNADQWNCVIDGNPCEIVISQPYPQWHDLCTCYQAQDWTLVERELETSLDGKFASVSIGEFTKDNRFGRVVFAGVLLDGTPARAKYRSIAQRLRDRWNSLTTTITDYQQRQPVLMIQVFCEAESSENLVETAAMIEIVRQLRVHMSRVAEDLPILTSLQANRIESDATIGPIEPVTTQ